MGSVLSGLFRPEEANETARETSDKPRAANEAAGKGSEDHKGVVTFHSSDSWQLHFNSLTKSPQLLVIDFSASWCGPCKFIEPAVHAMATKYTDVSFAKIDVDELPDVSQDFGVEAMPTFVLVKRGKELDRVVGADKDELENKIKEYRSS